MLRQLTINNYAIVDHLDIDLRHGMTVITGETGAGKSIMLDALGLCLGDRADRDVIREPAARADITACFAIGGNRRAGDWLRAHDFSAGDADEADAECLLRRVITREGRSKAYINSQPTTLNELRELGDMLIDIHSQHEHQSLLKTATHQRLLDDYCGLQETAAEVRRIATRWRQRRQELEALEAQAEDDNAQYQLLSYQVQELDELGLAEGDLDALETEHQQLSHAESSQEATRRVLDLCDENEDYSVRQALNQALSLLQDIPFGGTHLEEAGEMLNNALIQVEEAAGELGRALDQMELNPERLAEIDQRLADIHRIARKHRIAPAELPALHTELRDQLESMSPSEVKIDALREELNGLLADYRREAGRLSEGRRKGAARLEKAINARLSGLGMEGARFRLALETADGDEPRPNGREQIEFLVSTNAGQSPRPLIKVASGGELSRISLAIQVVTAQTSAIPTLVFDEVDVGIGGGVARAVGELLRQLGDQGQIICVTHQPQVASQGHHHLHVSKRSGKQATTTQIRELDRPARIGEIARMLGGDEPSEQSMAHAEEMMADSHNATPLPTHASEGKRA